MQTFIRAAAAAIIVMAAALPAAAQGNQKPWKCTAAGLKASNYTGGNTAYIHLTKYPTGSNYPVTKTGKTAVGATSDGTKFSCQQ